MIRIVGIQRNSNPGQEFVLLQNQGNLRVKLRGHIVASDDVFLGAELESGAHAFGDDELIPAGMFVILFSGAGKHRWAKTKEGQMIYYAYMGRESSIWNDLPGPVHILATQHTYAEKPPAVLLK